MTQPQPEITRESLGPIPFRAAPDTPRMEWPGGARLAFWIIPNIEWFPLDQPIPRGAGNAPDVPAWSTREYGNRVGIWRMMEVFDRAQARATVALNAAVCDVYPSIIRAGVDRGWEWMGHGFTNSQSLAGLPEAEERALIGGAFDRIAAATGARPKGWLGPGLHETPRTPELLVEAGAAYVADWVADDRPFWVNAGTKRLVGMPYSLEVNDIGAYLRMNLSPEQYCQHICRTFDVLYREGERNPAVMALPLHPYLSGFPARAAALEDALQYIKGHAGVWWATGGEIADAFARQSTVP